jgi:hypothetical protein
MKKGILNLLLILGLMVVSACSDDEEGTPFAGTDNSIISFNLTAANGTRYAGVITDDRVVVTVPDNVSLEGSSVDYSLCELATISPDPRSVTDWESSQTFVVKSYNNTQKTYYYELNRSQVASADNVILTTQADVDALAQSGVSIINGDLVIGDNLSATDDPVTDLSSLTALTTVKQNIFVYSSFAGTSLKGLENISSAAGLFIGSSTSAVSTVEQIDVDLTALKSLGSLVVNSNTVKSLRLPAVNDIGYFYILSTSLEEVNFDSFTTCHTDLIMRQGNTNTYNTTLAEVDFPSLESVGGLLTLNNYAAETITFPKLQSVGSAINLRYMKSWKEISFPELKQVNGELLLQYMAAVETLNMPKLEVVNGRFYVDMTYLNPVTKSFSFDALRLVNGAFAMYISPSNEADAVAFPALENASGMTFQSTNMTNMSIKTLSLPKLTQSGSVTVYGFVGVESLDFSGCTNMTKLTLITPSSLTELKTPTVLPGFELNAGSKALQEINIVGLEEVTNTFALSNLSGNVSASIGSIKKIGTFRFTDTNLKSLSMPDLEEINSLTVQSYSLTALKMDKLEKITSDCSFTYVRDMTDDGLSFASLKSIAGKLTISGYSTPALTTLKGFASLESVGSIAVTNMKNLVDFSALKTVAENLSSGWTTSGNGYNPTLSDMKNGNYVK